MMTKLLVYKLWVLFKISTANAIWCFHCDKPIPTKPCPQIQEFCWAGVDAACYTINLYIGYSMISSQVGCIQDCTDRKEDQPFMWQETICCYTDYCNV